MSLDIDAVLRPYQKEAYLKMVEKPNMLMYDDMRLGKTLTTLAAIQTLESYPVLIVCPKFALYVWKEEIERWLGQSAIIYSGTPAKRKKQWQEFVTSGCKFLITNYALLKDFTEATSRSALSKQPPTGTPKATPDWHWGAFIADEIHMGGLFNHKNNTFKLVDKLTKDISVKFLLTGTPFRQGCVDLYGPLHIVDRTRFKNYWQFVNRYCVVIDDVFGKSIERTPQDIRAFRTMLQGYMIRRVKSEVFRDLPQKQRQVVPIEMNKEQQKVYDELTENLIALIPDSPEVLVTQGQLTLMIRQRQLLVCPQVLGLKDRGAAIDTMIEMSHEQLDEGEPIVIYTPFRKAVPYIEQALQDEYQTCAVFKIQGKLTAEEFRDAWQGFQTQKHTRKVMICVIKSGAAFKASVASVGYFLGCEWDFNLNEQAEDRMFDPSDEKGLHVFYITHNGTVEDIVKDRLNNKKFSSDWVVGTDEQFKYLLDKKCRNVTNN